MPEIKLYLFGAFRLLVNDQPVDTFRSDKARVLLAYLALANNQPIARITLANLLWDGYQLESALASLRMTLSNLRQILAPFALLETTRQTVRLHTDRPQFWCDALTPDWRATLVLQEEFLPDGERIDSGSFQHWLQEQRTRYALARPEPTATPVRLVAPNNLHRVLTPLIGRVTDFELLNALVRNAEHPLITLVGEGGVGKTRLALAVAQASAEWQIGAGQTSPGEALPIPLATPHFSHGVWFVGLAGLTLRDDLADTLAAAIGAAIRFHFSGAEPLTDQLCTYLKDKRALLVLDNFEQLTAGADWLLTLLQNTTALKVLVTSRQRLDLEAEYVFRLDGLATPDDRALLAPSKPALLTYSSIQLFLHRAERTRHDFRLRDENLVDIASICCFVDGSPLGIVLATTLLEKFSCAEIVARLNESYTVLAALLGDLPPRQRSMHVVLEGSWQLLDATERQVLAQCAIFRGSFSAAAACQVADTTPVILERLEEKSLLRVAGLERFEMHELVRRFAATQLRLLPDLEQQACERHCGCYFHLVQQQGEQLHQSTQAQHHIRRELENVRTAWQWAIHQWKLDALATTLPALAHFYGLAGLQQEAATGFAETIVCLRRQLDSPATASAAQRLCAALLLEQAYFQLNLAQPSEAAKLVEEAQHLITPLADAELEVKLQLRLGDIAWAQGHYLRHQAAYEQSLAQAQAQGWQRLVAHSLTNLGMNHDIQGEYVAAIRQYQAALAIAQQIDHRQQINIIYNNLGVSHEWLGEFSAALYYYHQTLAASREFGDHEGIGVAHLNLGSMLTRLGDWENAAAHLEQAQKIFRLEGHQRLEAKTLVYQALLLHFVGDNPSAYNEAQQALKLAQQGGFRNIEAEALTALGHAQLLMGASTAASAAYRAALERWPALGQVHRVVLTQSGLAASLFQQGDLAGAQPVVEDLLITLAIYERMPMPSFVFLTCHQILQAEQDPRAEKILRRGYQELQKQAASITDPALQAKFLVDVELNRRLVELGSAEQTAGSDQQTVVRGE